MKLQMKREALEKLNGVTNEMPLDIADPIGLFVGAAMTSWS
jgi:hypothetical protein